MWELFNLTEDTDGEYLENRSDLGNIETGDGYKYRGGGYMHLTGRYRYSNFATYIGDNKILSEGSEYVATHYAWESAVWYWSNYISNEINEYSTVEDVTYAVNGGYNGFEDRRLIYEAWGMCLVNKCKHLLLIISLLVILFSLSCGMSDTDTAKFITSSYGIVQYPVFENMDGSELINDLIRNKAESLTDINLESKYDGIIEYSVLECNSEVISIKFYGDIVYLPTRKPLRIYSCMSIDVKKKEQIKLNDIVEIDENFIEDYMEKLRLKYQELHPKANHNPFRAC